jgi:hypothetical protein
MKRIALLLLGVLLFTGCASQFDRTYTVYHLMITNTKTTQIIEKHDITTGDAYFKIDGATAIYKTPYGGGTLSELRAISKKDMPGWTKLQHEEISRVPWTPLAYYSAKFNGGQMKDLPVFLSIWESENRKTMGFVMDVRDISDVSFIFVAYAE